MKRDIAETIVEALRLNGHEASLQEPREIVLATRATSADIIQAIIAHADLFVDDDGKSIAPKGIKSLRCERNGYARLIC